MKRNQQGQTGSHRGTETEKVHYGSVPSMQNPGSS